MLFERGPRALVDGTVELVRNFIAEDSSFRILCHSASELISERVTVLDSLQRMLAEFLAKVRIVICLLLDSPESVNLSCDLSHICVGNDLWVEMRSHVEKMLS